jgi:hypothetical protein
MANVLVCEPGRFAWTCAKTARSPSSPHARANGVDAIAYVEAIKTEEGFGHEHATAFSPRRSLSRSGRLPLVSMPEDRPQNAVTSRFDGLAGDRCLANTCDATEPCSVCGTALSLLFAELEHRRDQLLHQLARPVRAQRLHKQSVVHRPGARAPVSGRTQGPRAPLRGAMNPGGVDAANARHRGPNGAACRAFVLSPVVTLLAQRARRTREKRCGCPHSW